MTRSRFLFLLLSLALLVPVVSGGLTRAAAAGDEETDSLYKQLAVFSETLTLIRRAYVEESSVEALLTGALEGATDALDPLSGYLPAAAVEAFEVAREVGNRRSGLTVFKERGITFVVAVAPGSPGSEVGVERGDIVSEIDGRRTRRVPLWEVHRILAGPAGTEVEIELLRRGESHRKTLRLAEFGVASPMLEERRGAPVLRLASIDSATAAQVRERLEEVASREGRRLLLDLRSAAGGDHRAAYDVAALFVEGELGQLRRRDETLESFTGAASPVWSGEIVALIDRGTLGAAEILATVLRQAAAARLVGERSFGLAGRQSLERLPSGARLVLTDAFYTGPDGEPISQGLEPDVAVGDAARGFGEDEIPIDDLILEEGLDELLGEEESVLEKAA